MEHIILFFQGGPTGMPESWPRDAVSRSLFSGNYGYIRNLRRSLPQQRPGPELRGADDRPNSLEKRDKREQSFSQRKRLTMNALHSLKNRARMLFAQHISVCHLVLETLTRIGTPPKAFHNTHTSETKSPEGKREDDVFHRHSFMPADAH